MPAVSIIIPAYNSARYLTEAVDSALAQSFQDFEILVIDDGSTDETEIAMRRYGPPVRYLRQPNSGVAAARNRGIAESRGRYLAFLDADDAWLPNKLERQLAALSKCSRRRVCYSAFTVVDERLAPLRVSRRQPQGPTLEELLLRGNVVGNICTVLGERQLFMAAGGFDPALSQCADWDLWMRLAAHGDFLYLDEPLAIYRQHGANMSRNVRLLECDSLRLLEKAFAQPELPDALRAQRRTALARNYMVLAGSYFGVGQYRDFMRCALRAVAMDFHQAGYLLAYPARVASRRRAQDSLETA